MQVKLRNDIAGCPHGKCSRIHTPKTEVAALGEPMKHVAVGEECTIAVAGAVAPDVGM